MTGILGFSVRAADKSGSSQHLTFSGLHHIYFSRFTDSSEWMTGLPPPSNHDLVRAGILDLPIELISKIIHDQATDLFVLAQVNRFLNRLVMNYYLPPLLPDPHHIEDLWLDFEEDKVVAGRLQNHDSSYLGTPVPFGKLLSSRSPKLSSIQSSPVCQYAPGHPYDTPTCQSKVLSVNSTVPRIALDLSYSVPSDFDIWSAFPKNSTDVPTSNATAAYLPPTSIYPPVHHFVTEIILSASLFLIFFLTEDSGFLDDLMDFLQIFKGLKVLTIIDTGAFTRHTDSRMEVVDCAVFRLLKARCRNVQTVKLESVDGKVKVHHI
ncbi:hypothetical protein BDN72DRAFT_961390 [Pluteus cervinus]|uniref:Uncharacterized protein n=1 Tax=Pluteus cervinus TaxID=181527 RepID=A0ACD3ALZ7_9AGAR|nr:hypothetical protein BDN72DRAFT_961390 [Pluteus cervinus]